jgi:hypothetical protein
MSDEHCRAVHNSLRSILELSCSRILSLPVSVDSRRSTRVSQDRYGLLHSVQQSFSRLIKGCAWKNVPVSSLTCLADDFDWKGMKDLAFEVVAPSPPDG